MKRHGGCLSGCWTFVMMVFAIGLMIDAWQSSSWLARAGEVAVAVVVVSVALVLQARRLPRPAHRVAPHPPGGPKP